jgi:rod shape-determining protein MreB
MELEVSSPDICSALAQPLTILLKGIISEFKLLSPRVVTDLMENGIILCGGGAQLTDLSSFLQEKLNIPVILIDKPQRVMVMGAAQLLEQEPYAHWFV